MRVLGIWLCLGMFIAALAPADEEMSTFRLEDVTVLADKRLENMQDVPMSITALDRTLLRDAMVQDIVDASWYVPNLFIGGFGSRHTRIPFVRGLAAGQGDPVVTVFVDGVPQLTMNTVDLELVSIDRIEVLRGPQGPLYGRNTLGGAINIVTRPPPAAEKVLYTRTAIGNYDALRFELDMGAPINESAAWRFGGTWQERDGYTKNTVTGDDVDHRDTLAGRFQLRLNPIGPIEVHLSLFGQRDRDGGFTLYDLESLRRDSHRIRHDFEGHTERDVIMPAATIRVYGSDIDFISTTAYEYWKTDAATDLDFSEADVMRRFTLEEQDAFFQEFRFQSPAETAIDLNDRMRLTWMAGVAFFYSDYQHESENRLSPSTYMNPAPFPLSVGAEYRLRDVGVAPFAEATLNICDHWDISFGLRYEYERREADYSLTFPGMPQSRGSVDESYDQLLPRLTISYHWTERLMTYGYAGMGYRPGGYNRNTMPFGERRVDEETSWTYEVGAKSRWFDDRLMLNLALFHIRWDDMQVDVPIPGLPPGSFQLDNAAKASSSGFEVESQWQVTEWLHLFGGVGYADAKYDSYRDPWSGADASGHQMPYAPAWTWHTGLQVGHQLAGGYRWFARAEVVGFADIYYDSANSEGESGGAMLNLRTGIRRNWWGIEAYVDNVTDESYVPIAIPAATPSGWAGRSSDPRTVGIAFTARL